MATEKKELSLEDKIKLHKKDHNDIFVIEVDDKYCLLKKPDRNTFELALGLIANVMGGEPKYITAGLRIMQACWIDGHKEIMSNDDYLVPAAMQAVNLIEIKSASLKKN
jgi:hypothetical protein